MDAPSPLTPEQRDELTAAQARVGTFLGAAKVAAFNGWTIGFFAVVSLLFGIFSLTSLLIGIGLAIVARNEFKGAAGLRSLDPEGLQLLWRNQVGFMTLIIAYSLWSMFRALYVPDPQIAEITQLLGPGTEELVRSLTLTLYGAVIAATGIFQGLNARYYFLRVARLEAYLRETPEWIVEVQRSTVVG